MSEAVENKPVDVPAAEPAPAEDTAAVDTVSTTLGFCLLQGKALAQCQGEY